MWTVSKNFNISKKVLQLFSVLFFLHLTPHYGTILLFVCEWFDCLCYFVVLFFFFSGSLFRSSHISHKQWKCFVFMASYSFTAFKHVFMFILFGQSQCSCFRTLKYTVSSITIECVPLFFILLLFIFLFSFLFFMYMMLPL